METGEALDTTEAAPLDGDSTSPEVRDYEAEARKMGWTPKDDFKGDERRWIDAETFVKRGEEMMPILKAQNKKLREDLDDMKRQMRKASEFFSKAEQRAYEQALADVKREHAEAVELGDAAAAGKAVDKMRQIEKEFEADKGDGPPKDDKPTEAQLKAELDDWIEANDWYLLDEKKRTYADHQAQRMGPADDWPKGRADWFAELAKRVNDKFSDRPAPVNGSPGARVAATGGAKTYANLPPDAKKMCDKWVKNGLIKDRETYVKSYQWD